MKPGIFAKYRAFLITELGLSQPSYLNRSRRRTADLREYLSILLHLRIVFKRGKEILEDPCLVGIGRCVDAIVHPLSVTPASHQSGALEVGEMPRDLRIIRIQSFSEKADAHLT